MDPLAPQQVETARGTRPSGRVADKAVVDLAIDAQRIVERAKAEAAAIVQQAQAERDRIVTQAHREGLDEATARLAASWVALRAKEVRADRDAEDRVIAVARMLAERLLGEALRVEPSTVVALAREAMQPVRRAGRVLIEAHPDDAMVLRDHLAELPVDPEVVDVAPDASRQRGCVRVVSNLGTLEADLSPQLDRLAEALRQGLRQR